MPTTEPSSVTLPARVRRWEALGGASVYWHVETLPSDSRRRPRSSALAESRVEQIVRECELFEWRGFAPRIPWAKPRLREAPGADASISHSGDLLLVAVSLGARVGADIEAPPFDAFDSRALERRMCTAAEHERADALGDVARRRYLARAWTAKEATAKATGQGLALDFRSWAAAVGHDDLAAVDAAVPAAHLALVIDDGTSELLNLETEIC